MNTAIKESEIFEVIDQCIECENTGSNFPSMTYEQGVQAALDWIMGRSGNPME